MSFGAARRLDLPDRLVTQAAAGDAQARAALVRAIGPLVLGLCRRLADEPDDAFQAVWERVFAALPGFDPAGPAKLSTWVATIAHRWLVDRHRQRVRHGAVVPLPESLSAVGGPEEELLARQRQARLEAALAALPDELHRVIVAHHLGEVPLTAIAENEGVPVGTIKSRLHRGRARLAELLGGAP